MDINAARSSLGYSYWNEETERRAGEEYALEATKFTVSYLLVLKR